MGDSRKKVSAKNNETRLRLKRRLYLFQLNRELPIDDHMNNYTKFLTNLVNMDVAIEEEDKALILLNSLPDEECEIFILTLINGKHTLNYSDVSATLVNYEMRRKDKQFSFNSTSVEALTVRDKGSNRKGKGERERSKSRPDFRDLKKNQ